MFQRRSLFSLVSAALVALPAWGQESSKLEWDWAKYKGKTFYQTMTTKTTQNMKVQGTSVDQEQKQTFHFSIKVVDVKDGIVTLEQQIIGLEMHIDIGGSKIDYDSAKPDAGTTNPLNKFFNALKSAKFTLTIDTKKNKITDIKGHDAFVKELTAANPQMQALLEKLLSKQALQEMCEPVFCSLPGKKVVKGKEDATWKQKSDLDMGPLGKYETTYTYTYDGTDKNSKEEKITVKTELKYTPPAGGAQDASANLPFKITKAALEGKDGTGTLVFDPKAGWLKSADLKLTLDGTITIEIGQQSTEVSLHQVQSTTITTSDKNPAPAK